MPPLPVITGLGFVTSIGHDQAAVLRNLRELRHGFEPVEFFGNAGLPVKVAGTVKGFAFPTPNWRDWRWPENFTVDRELIRGLAPHGVYAVCAVQQALADAGLSAADLAGGDTGLYCASAGSPFLLGHMQCGSVSYLTVYRISTTFIQTKDCIISNCQRTGNTKQNITKHNNKGFCASGAEITIFLKLNKFLFVGGRMTTTN